jgi:hypothetical protein
MKKFFAKAWDALRVAIGIPIFILLWTLGGNLFADSEAEN